MTKADGAPGTHVALTSAAGPDAARARAAALEDRAAGLARAVEVGGGRLDPTVVERAEAIMRGVRERLDLGVEHTVVALVGGTGSGKSSLFNAVTGFDFADAGVRRPTTSRVTACTWGGGSTALLAWLGVDDDRRIERESELDGGAEAALRGLVLLDLPDHDSIDPAHREVVDRLLPMADLLVWVVDPQKYADDALHSGYLRKLRAHEAAMLVVLNQIDTVRAEVRDDLVRDVARLLVEDGLSGVPVATVSARTGVGIPELREHLADVVAGRSVGAARAEAELADAATLLSSTVADAAAAPLPRDEAIDALGDAAGLPAVAAAIGAVVRGADRGAPDVGAVQLDTVKLARTRWLEQVGQGLPPRWSASLEEAVPGVGAIASATRAAVARLGLAARPSRLASALAVMAGLVGALATVAGSAALGAWLVSGLSGATRADGAVLWSLGWGGVAGVVAGCTAVSVALALVARAARHRAAARRSSLVLRDGRALLAEVVDAQLVAPTEVVLSDHETVRAATRRSTDPHTGGAPRVGTRPSDPTATPAE